MKKQLLIAAVAATMASVSMADISISGDAKYRFASGDKTVDDKVITSATMEANLKVTGTAGASKLVADIALDNRGAAATGATKHVENLILTTKIGSVNVKVGNYSSPTTALLGEIDNGNRANGKITLSTTVNGVKLYTGTDPTDGNKQMFTGVSAKVSGWTLQAKKNNEKVNSFGIAGKVANVGIRIEQKRHDDANKNVIFANITVSGGGFDLGYAYVKADADDLIKEDDSSIFAVSNDKDGNRNEQISVGTKAAGNGITLKLGAIKNKAGAKQKYQELAITRSLAAGSTLTVDYQKKGHSLSNTNKDTRVRAAVSVKF